MGLRDRTAERIPARQLRLQAGLDNELSVCRGKCVSKVSSNGRGTRKLLLEFCWLKSVLVGNELKRQVPQTREDYWRGILEIIGRKCMDANPSPLASGDAWPYI